MRNGGCDVVAQFTQLLFCLLDAHGRFMNLCPNAVEQF
jgi:hypothetical protein